MNQTTVPTSVETHQGVRKALEAIDRFTDYFQQHHFDEVTARKMATIFQEHVTMERNKHQAAHHAREEIYRTLGKELRPSVAVGALQVR